ncbi:MAG: carbon-nitrogen hydrolase family protein [Nanoarchaeota archaeon]
MKKRKPRIALAQIKYFDLNKKNNLQKIKLFIKKASRLKADIVCFPETCMLRDRYLHFRHSFLKEVREECRKNSIWCILTEDFMFGSKLYNVAVLIDREGRVRGKYKKIKLYAERNVNPGRIVRVFNTDFGKIGIAICWDLAFPELFNRMKKLGAEIVFCPAQWAYEKKAYESEHKKRELKLLKSIITARAFENLFFVAFCSPFRNQKDMICYSAIASPHKILKEIFEKEGIIYADLNLSEIKKFKRIYPGK